MQQARVTLRISGDLYSQLVVISEERDCTLQQSLDFYIERAKKQGAIDYDARVAADVARLKAKVEREVKGAVAKQLEAIHDAGAKANPKPEAKPKPKPEPKPEPKVELISGGSWECPKCHMRMFANDTRKVNWHKNLCKGKK